MPDHRLTFVIPKIEHEALKAMAEANDRSAGAEVRAAVRARLADFLGHHNERPPAEGPGAESDRPRMLQGGSRG